MYHAVLCEVIQENPTMFPSHLLFGMVSNDVIIYKVKQLFDLFG